MPTRRLLLCLFAILAISAPTATADIYQWEWIDPNHHNQAWQQSDGEGVDAAPSADLIDPCAANDPRATNGSPVLTSIMLAPGFNDCAALNRDLDLAMAWLGNVDLTQADLTNTSFGNADLSDADFGGAIVSGTSFSSATDFGFTSDQLYSTASYQADDLSGINFRFNDSTDRDFTGKDPSTTAPRK